MAKGNDKAVSASRRRNNLDKKNLEVVSCIRHWPRPWGTTKYLGVSGILIPTTIFFFTFFFLKKKK